jgi:hypothetical protein
MGKLAIENTPKQGVQKPPGSEDEPIEQNPGLKSSELAR